MAVQAINTLKNWFKTGLKPTQSNFWDWLDSYRHKSDAITMADLDADLQDTINNAASPSNVIVLPAGTASTLMQQGDMLKSVLFIDDANPANVSIGTTDDGTQIADATTMETGWLFFDCPRYFPHLTTIYFVNITPTTIIKIFKA